MEKIKLNNEIVDRIRVSGLPAYRDIPDIGLYLNQVAKYINEYLEVFGELGITESMISNYVKQGIIESPKKKLYYREQIAYLFFIAIAKSILSLDNVRYLIEKQKEMEPIEKAYTDFAEKFMKSLFNIFGLAENTQEDETLIDKIIINITHKIYIDYYFAAQKK